MTIKYAPTTNGQNDKATLTATSNKPPATASLTLLGTAKASPALTTTASPGGPVGSTTVKDTATLAGGSAPTGTITFKLFGPSATADCTGTPVDTETTAVASGNGSYATPSGFIAARAGSYWWTASYSGDASNNPAATHCGQESVAIGPAAPVITTAPFSQGAALINIGSLRDTATLAGGSAPTGTITFKLFGPSAAPDCTTAPVDTETVGVSDNGSYTTPGGFTPTQPGTYWWTVHYSGDAFNNPADSACGDEQMPVGPGFDITTTASPGGPLGSTTLTDTATLAGGTNPTGTIEFKLYGPSPAPDCTGTPVFTIDAAVISGDGSYTTPAGFTPFQPGSYWWTARYSGDDNNSQGATACGDEQATIGP